MGHRKKKGYWDIPNRMVRHVGSVLTLFGDEGPKDLPVYWFLMRFYRAIFMHDPLHRCPRDMQAAAKESNNWAMVLDTTSVVNYDHGPFQSCTNFQKLLECIEHYCDTAPDDCDLLDALIDGLVMDNCDGRGCDMSSKTSVKDFLMQLKFDDCFQCMTGKTKWTRWGSHHWAMKSFIPNRYNKLLACVVCAVVAGVKLTPPTLVALGLLHQPDIQAALLYTKC